MPIETFEFINARGSRLSGKIEAPEVTPRGWALLAHCFTCGKESLAAVRVSRALARAGIGVLRFDFGGLGGSDGDFADTTFSADVSDLIMAASAMGEAGKPVSLLVGHRLCCQSWNGGLNQSQESGVASPCNQNRPLSDER